MRRATTAHPAPREVGQIRFAALDALMPLGATTLLLHFAANASWLYLCGPVSAGVGIAIVRLTAYLGK